MQQLKGIKNISEITEYCQESTKLTKTFSDLLSVLNLSYINALLSKSKTKGVKPKNIFQLLFGLQFLDLKNIQQLMLSGFSKELSFKKDVFYDFMKNPLINWRSITYLFSKQILALIQQESEQDERTPVFLVVDDSLLPKSGKRIEFIGKVYDHCSHLYHLGIKMLTIGVCDGKSFIPLDFSLHNESGKTGKRGLKSKDLKAQFSKNRTPEMASYKRVLEVSNDKISTAIRMIKEAVKKGMKANYVLVDSWFVTEKFITEINHIKKGLFVIGLMKTNRIINLHGKKVKANIVGDLKRKQIKYNQGFKCHYIPLTIEYKGIKLKAFWIKMKGQKHWKLLVSSDTKLSFSKAMKYYQVRWSIEVFFKDCKQNLNLLDCQSTDFDSHIAHISIVFMNYMLLALKKRIDDYETFGIIFREVKEQILRTTLIEKIWFIFIEIFNQFLADLGVDWDVFVAKLIDNQNQINNQIKATLQCLFSLNSEIA